MKHKTLALILITALVASAIIVILINDSGSSTAAEDHNEETGHFEGEESHADHGTKGVEIAGLKTTVAYTGEGWDTVIATGKVTLPHDRVVEVTPRIAGKVISARGTVGDIVSKGQVLAIISSFDLAEARSQYRQAQARLKAAENSYAREMHIVKLGANSARPYEEARADSLAAEGELSDAKSELAQAKSELAREESELIQCKSRLDRARELYASKIISKHDMETAEAEYRRDSASVDTAKSKVIQAEARIDKAKSKLDISKQYSAREEKIYNSRVHDLRSVQTVKNDIASARIEVQAATDRIKVLGASVSGSGDSISVVSPITGRIIARDTNIGEMASPDKPLFTVANLGQVWIEADVYEKDLARVHKGHRAEIRVDSYPDRIFTGKVSSISDILSPDSRTAKVRCVVSNSQGLLRGEMFAKISLFTSKRAHTILVPKEAVLDDAGKKIVFSPCMDCPEDTKAGRSLCGSYDKAEVTVGSIRGNTIEILDGIESGTLVVSTGAYQLKTALGSGKLEAGCTDH